MPGSAFDAPSPPLGKFRTAAPDREYNEDFEFLVVMQVSRLL